MDMPCLKRREEKVFVAVMQRARICLLLSAFSLGDEEGTYPIANTIQKSLVVKYAYHLAFFASNASIACSKITASTPSSPVAPLNPSSFISILPLPLSTPSNPSLDMCLCPLPITVCVSIAVLFES
jgi:hypothetical protein